MAGPRVTRAEMAEKFREKHPTENDYTLCIQIDAKEGEHVDLLLPMLPCEREVFDQELIGGAGI